MDRERLLSTLVEEVKTAKKHLQDTSDYLDLAIQNHRGRVPSAKSHERVRLAARAYRLAIEDLATKMSRLKELGVEGIVPHDLEPRPPRKAEHSGTSASRRSA